MPAKHGSGQEPQPVTFLAPEDATFLADLTRLRALVAELTARYRPSTVPEARGLIRSPREVVNLLAAEMEELPQEQLRVVLLNSKNQVLDVLTLYQGTLNSSPVRIAELFRQAIVANAASIVMAHCHPSGDPTPSPEDVRITAEAVKAGQLLDIEVLDHVIIGKGRHVSLKERGLGFV
jgi:DNA repair protein RadC